jgi:hypothetical protein
MALVQVIIGHVREEFGCLDALQILHDLPGALRTEKPYRIGGYVPDVYACDAPITVTTLEVLEGNSRLAAYRQLAAKEPIKYGHVKCTMLPADVDESLVFALLGQVHIKGKKDWAPFEQAGFLYRRHKDHHLDSKSLAAEVGLTTKKVNHLIETYEFMISNDEDDISRWSYYDEYLKSNKIRKARQQHVGLDALVVDSIKKGTIPRAVDLREKLPVVCSSPPVLLKYATGSLSLGKAYERALDSGADNVPYKKASAFRRWVTQPEVDSMLAESPAGVRKRVLFELEKIANRITALTKKHQK